MKGVSGRFIPTSLLAAGVFFVACAVLSAESTSAATFAVDSTIDAVDAIPGDGVCETVPGSGICTLRAAIQEANATPELDTVDLPAGTYALTLAGAEEDAAATGDLDLTAPTVVQGAGAGVTIVDARGLDRAFDLPTVGCRSGDSWTFRGLTITGGVASDGGGFRSLTCGPGPVLEDLVVRGNQASGSGGGVFSVVGVDIRRSTIENNRAGRFGGGVFNVNLGPLVVEDSTLRGNEAADGGGAFHGAAISPKVRMTRVVFADNRATNGNGGGLSATTTGTLTDCVFSRNTASGDGGGVYMVGGGFVRVLVEGNQATNGGGLRAWGGLVNSTISGNRATESGGGMVPAPAGDHPELEFDLDAQRG